MWRELWTGHRGKLIGVCAGLLHGFLYLIVGFWDMLFFGLLLLIGYTVGRRVDSGQPIVNWEPLLAWLNERWRPFK
ncbi:DUF2273 domain-containing protein [Xylanibacillus composti]|uniref:DUF2273 domain-containing protein n=1 Tax=Xylanibacillus composti TaxID=1572762 RepID=A0A8J4H6Q6_9BACL|nr:DUF2273 domain-containing protein [Xylanibacillus composti]MDT9726290.1 DUF2273 domain-containing protein [Xylanibacillus composti]GIQ70681.1 hypothetical protein XYCOK13_35050 [Xylanibacillus composti]